MAMTESPTRAAGKCPLYVLAHDSIYATSTSPHAAYPHTPSSNALPDGQERTGRRRPFSNWVKKLANFKNGSSSAEGGSRHGQSKRDGNHKASKKRGPKLNNPYPQSGHVGASEDHSHPSLTTNDTGVTSVVSRSRESLHSSMEGIAPPRSTAPTVSTEHDATLSINAPSHMASTFSSPAPSVRSLTTTLTTIQSMAANGNANNAQAVNQNGNHLQAVQYTQPFPTASPASAIPPHMAQAQAQHSTGGHPTTYNMATANNLLTDNASILTLASSSNRHRRRSFDTDASVRALAPSSLWGGSRESLPLSVLSANVDGSGIPTTPRLHQTTSRIANNERTSIYSTTGVVPTLPSERNSYYAKQSIAGDATSVRSGLLGHGRADSISGSVGGVASPLASPLEVSEGDQVDEKAEGAISADRAEGQEK
ncbi:hypothetical protein PG994_001658 [Apiospora phragmitis]|uniref:Ca2+-modulated nonselective cation channel polycystin n=1 Tax=Apiospora phragmitis TaxID=2905665 RepID=A0ABR1WU89_9PEZI